VSSVST